METSKKPLNLDFVEASGPRPFVTRRVFRRSDGSLCVWLSRHHRKSLVHHEATRAEATIQIVLRCLWMPRELNWWIGTIFALGSMLFAIASLGSLFPKLIPPSLGTVSMNTIYFAGSIPFTTAAYLQLFQSANAAPFPADASRVRRSWYLFGWKPKDVGWLSCAFQFAGTIFFNFNTFDAMSPSLDWLEKDLIVWVPNIAGSILFLLSGYLAFMETCHGYWAWDLENVSWWVVWINLLGCVGFMTSAVLSMGLPGKLHFELLTLAVTFTLQGAICFLVGSLLMLPETAREATKERTESAS